MTVLEKVLVVIALGEAAVMIGLLLYTIRVVKTATRQQVFNTFLDLGQRKGPDAETVAEAEALIEGPAAVYAPGHPAYSPPEDISRRSPATGTSRSTAATASVHKTGADRVRDATRRDRGGEAPTTPQGFA